MTDEQTMGLAATTDGFTAAELDEAAKIMSDVGSRGCSISAVQCSAESHDVRDDRSVSGRA